MDTITPSASPNYTTSTPLARWALPSCEITLLGQEALRAIVRVTETGRSYATEVRSPFKSAAQVPATVKQDFYAKVVSSQGIPVAVELCPRGMGGGKFYSPIKYQVDPIFLSISLNQDPKTPEELVSGLSQLSHEDERVSRYFAFASYFIKSFSSNPIPTKANIDGLVTLVLCGNQDITHSVINQLTDRIRNNTLLNIDLVLGLADAIDRSNPQHLNPDDLIQVMFTIVERISKTHTKGVEQSQKSQLKALIRVLNAMVDVNVCDLSRDKQEEIKALLGNFSESDSTTVQCLAAYAQEALKRVPNDETKLAAFLRVSVGLVKGVYYFYSAVSKIDPGALVDGFFSLQESAQGIVQFARQVQENFVDALPDAQEGLAAFGEGVSSLRLRKLTWYDEIRYVEMLIASNSFEALEMFLLNSRLQKEPAFISILVEKLHEVTASHPILLVRNETIRLMQNLYQNDRQWNGLTFKEDHFKNEGPGKLEVLNRDSIRVWIGIKGSIVSQMESYQRIPELKSTATKVLEALSQRASGEEQAFVERRKKSATQITPKKTSQASLFPSKPREEFSLEVKLEKMRSSIVEDPGLQQEKPFYVSPRGTFYPGSNTTFDLIEEVEKFLEGSQKVLLLQGDSGTGKTLFAKLLSERLWTRYKPGKGEIPFYVALPTIKEPSHNLINEAAQRFSFTLEDMAKMKDSREIIWILDGYDEIPAHTDILEQNGLADSKVIVLCRSEALPLIDMFIPIVNGKPKKSLLREIHLAPFSQSQIDVYIKKCIELGNAEWKDVGTYRKMIEEIAGLSELVQNPFILKIIVDTLPEICDQVKNIDSSQRLVITRHALYKAFTEEWFQKGFIRAKKDFAKLKSHGLKPDSLKKDAHVFCVSLANEMQLRGATHLQYDTEAPDSTLESLLGEDQKVTLLRSMAPLKVVGEGVIAFLHKSLQEYFIAVGTQEVLRTELITQHKSRASVPLKIEEAPLQSDSPPITFAIEPKAAGYTLPPVRPLKVVSEQLNPSTIRQTPVEPAHKKGANIEALRGIPFFDMLLENSVWLFLADVSKSDTAFQTQLLEVIKASKTDESYATASANAMSVLNLAGFSFSGIDLSGIRAPGAYLAYGNFFGTDLRKAQIPRANLTGAVLSNAHFEGANMEGVKLGQLPLIQLDDEVYRLLLTKDGKRLICSVGYNIRILDIASGKETACWTGSSGMKAMLLFDNDRKLVTGSTSNHISLWDISTGREIKRLVGHKGWVFALALLDNEKKIVSGSWDQTIRIWNSETGEQLEVLTADSRINALIALPNDRSFVAGSAMNGELKIWNSETGTVERRLIGHSHSIDALAVLGDEGKLASGGGSPKDYTIRIWNTNTGGQITVFEGHTGCVVALTALERGKKLASASWDATVRVWDVELGQQLQKFEGHTGFPNTIVPLANGNTLASAGKDKTIRFWKLQEEIGPKRAEWNGWVVYCLTLVDDGKQLASAGGGKAIFLHDIKTGKELGQLRIPTERDPDVHALVSFDRGRKLASAGEEVVIRIWDVFSKQLIHLLSGHTKSVYSIALLDQKTLASASEDNSLRIWNITTGQALKTLSNSLLSEQSVRSFPGALIRAITPLEEGKRVGLMLHDRTWREFDTESAQEIKKTAIKGFDGNVRMIGTTVSLGIKKKIAVGRKGYKEIKEFSICIIDPETGDELRKLIGNQTFLTALAAIEPGAKLVSAAEDRTIRIYDILSSKELCKIGCPFEVRALHFQAPDLLFAGDKRGSSGGSNSQGALWCWQLDFKAEGLNPKLLWCTRTSFETSRMKIKGVSGLSAENRHLFLQHGAEE